MNGRTWPSVETSGQEETGHLFATLSRFEIIKISLNTKSVNFFFEKSYFGFFLINDGSSQANRQNKKTKKTKKMRFMQMS